MTIREIQAALARLGYRPGPLDGIWGRQTAAAVRAFQAANGLEVDGVLGALTVEKLGGGDIVALGIEDPSLLWFQEARRLLGTREKPGAGSNPVILDWADDMDLKYDSDNVAWCGLFVGHCIASTLDREPTPSSVLRARAWERFGIPTAPTIGAIMVFWREEKGGPKGAASPFGHVGFYAGQDKKTGDYRILGGNQSNSVSLAWIAEERLVAARWPSTVPPRLPNVVYAKRDEQLSWQEA